MTLDPTRQLPGTAVTANEALFDGMVRHQTHLLRMAGSVRNEIFELLNATEADIARRIRDSIRTGISPANLIRAERVMRAIQRIRGAAWDKIDTLTRKTFNDLVLAEARFAGAVVKTTAPVLIDSTLPSVSQLKALLESSPFEGRFLREWSSKLRADDLARIQSQIRIGVVQGEPTPTVAQRIVGTARRRGTDGVTQITRRQAEGVVRMATNHFANQARREFMLENSEFFQEELYVATLDSATTAICRSLDGRRFPVGQGPYPPVHFACRSLRVAVFDGGALGERPAKPITQRQVLREFTGNKRIGNVTSRDKLPHGTKSAFDRFLRQRTREMTGPVPAKVTYERWLKTQSKAFQDDTLGIIKAKLFRQGKLPLDRFVAADGTELSLRDLARSDAAAFRAAGLDPKDFT